MKKPKDNRIVVLRLNHREGRDDRISTHVCLVARAFGASGVIIADVTARQQIETLEGISRRWGGQFWVSDQEPAKQTIVAWKRKNGVVVNLSMYGEELSDVITDIYLNHWVLNRELLVVVGSSKVPSYVYQLADYNVAITHQPHSEVAALALFLSKVGLPFDGINAELKVSPRLRSKGRVRSLEEKA